MAKDKEKATEEMDAPAEEGAAEGGEGVEAGEEKAGGFNAKKIILFVVLPLLLLVAIGGGLYFTGMLDGLLGKKGEETAEAGAEHGEKKAEGGHGGGEAGAGLFVVIPTMIVNLSSEDETPRYLRLTVQLEMNSAEDQKAVEAVIPRVIDQFQTYLRELRVRDLRGSGGIYRLQMELLWRVNQAAAPIEVKDVLFQEILIQ